MRARSPRVASEEAPGAYKDVSEVVDVCHATGIANKVVRLKLDSKGNILSHEDFITGWLRKSGNPDGRPVDIEQSPEGDIYLSDDYLGVVYRITKKMN